MTELNESSSGAERAEARPVQSYRSGWVWAVATLGFVVVALNVAVFLLIQDNQRLVGARETAVLRREQQVDLLEQQRQGILVPVHRDYDSLTG